MVPLLMMACDTKRKAFEICQALRERGCEVSIVCPGEVGNWAYWTLIAVGEQRWHDAKAMVPEIMGLFPDVSWWQFEELGGNTPRAWGH